MKVDKAQELSVDKRVGYINSLELDVKSLKKLRKEKIKIVDEDEAGYVDSGSLVSFVSGISALEKSDVLNSTLLAQLAANTAFDRWEDTENWYKKYVEVLENVGWVIENFNFTKYKTKQKTFTMDKAVLEILRAIATGEQEEVINETIDALEALDDGDGKLVLFDTNGSNLTKGNFQMATAQSDGETVSMALGAFYFSSKQSATRFLWFEYKKISTTLFKAAQKVVLNEEVYDKVRDAINKKLGDAAVEYVANLDIGF